MANVGRFKLLMQKRGTIEGQITCFSNFLEKYKAEESPNLHKLTLRFEKFKLSYVPFDEISDELELLDEENATSLAVERFEIQENYMELHSEAELLIIAATPVAQVQENISWDSTTKQTVTQSSVEVENTPQILEKKITKKRRVNLPEASLPSFTGRYEDWLSFKDSFLSMIDNQDDLSNVEKLQYLKSALKGEAAKKIKNITITDENYQRAWDLVKNFYEDESLIVSRHLSLILRLPIQKRECADGLRRLVDDTLQHVESLSALGVQITEQILVQNLEEKLHETTAEKWDEIRKPGVFPTLKEITDFMNRTASRLIKRATEKAEDHIDSQKTAHARDLQSRKGKGKKKPHAHNFLLDSSNKCAICHDDQLHPVWRCKKFLNLTYAKRIQAAKSASLCLTCLRKHDDKACKFEKCLVCEHPQNMLLHEHQTRKESK